MKTIKPKESAQDVDGLTVNALKLIRRMYAIKGELLETRTRLTTTEAELLHSNRINALGEAAAGLAHELNQPLSIIIGLTQSLLKQSSPEKPEFEKLKLIAAAAQRMAAITTHLRLFSTSGGEEPKLGAVYLNTVVKNSLLMINELLAGSWIDLKLNLHETPPFAGFGSRIEQVIINLVCNARDAMPGGGALEISTAVIDKNRRKHIRLSVADTGCGIPPEIMPRIFTPFFTTKPSGKGTGLGLSISRKIVMEHGGGITAENRAGGGAVFHVTLPLCPLAGHCARS